MSAERERCVVVAGGSSSTHARIPAKMVRDAGYRVVLADAELSIAPGAYDYFDAVYPVATPLERFILAGRQAVVRNPAERRRVEDIAITKPTRRRTLYFMYLRGWLRGRRLRAIVQREHPGVVHVQSTLVCGDMVHYYLRGMAGGLGDFAHRPGTLVHLFSYQPRFPEIREMEKQTLAACDQIHTSSPVVAQIYHDHYEVPPEKMHILVRGISLETFAARDEATLDQARREWGVPKDKFVLIHNRHMHRMYCVELAVETFIELSRRKHDVFLLLVRGSMHQADYEEELLNMLREAGLRDRVVLLPHILSADQMAVALQLADCSINTVPFDAFPVSILESMYCHAVPVVRDLDSYKHFVREGETGYLCGGTGVAEYVAKTEQLIVDAQLKQRMAAAGAELVRRDGDVEQYRRRLLELIERCWREW